MTKKMLSRIVSEVTPMAKKIMTAFCPGPITIILPKSDIVPKAVTGGLDTIAVRMPDNDIARALIKYADTPIAAPSANISGRPSPTTAQAVYKDLQSRIDMVFRWGSLPIWCRVYNCRLYRRCSYHFTTRSYY